MFVHVHYKNSQTTRPIIWLIFPKLLIDPRKIFDWVNFRHDTSHEKSP